MPPYSHSLTLHSLGWLIHVHLMMNQTAYSTQEISSLLLLNIVWKALLLCVQYHRRIFREGHYVYRKTPNPKCRLYWCLLEFIDWRYSQSCWYFRPALWTVDSLTLSLVNFSPPPPPLPCVNKYILYTRTQTDKTHLPQSPFTGHSPPGCVRVRILLWSYD